MVESAPRPLKMAYELIPLEDTVRYHLTCGKRGCGLTWHADVLWEEADQCIRRARCASSLARSIIEEHTRSSCYRTQVEVLNLDVYTAHNCARG
jgi:hypothetical protein